MKQQPNDTFILVHGGFHGAWCWDKLRPFMEEKGFVVITPDYTGNGKEFHSYTTRIGALLEKQQQPVIILGHSSGGMVITELAKKYPDKIKGLIYLSAFLLPEGMSPPEIMQDDTISLMQSSLIIDKSNGTVRVNKKKAKQLFYADCEDPVAQWAISKLTPEPVKPAGNKENSRTDIAPEQPIRRFYIETLQDKALGITSQRRMQYLLPCEKVYTLTSGHSPFLSQPGKLAAVLADISTLLNSPAP
ncbi:Pimeloyl-ACP methyl ester carboxylesterase [Chitinophaga ginsengisegetis]|uniref:Pimeloyl-ACP methyl ester carboxylesterase n=1 Tax=Chitinophaga ginsengisegetis TaxID=393003 RepID=A0A1T5N4E1_9BACT|nr:alpha/beta fold hydrolase [Chitinophaga ginsengisegetis]SKC95326.1 Pimeloyl-ACP methyl ester carboxylesterase [Chitinophaga ginsengisegetis]